MVGFLRFGIGSRKLRYVFSRKISLLRAMDIFEKDFGSREINVLKISPDGRTWEVEVGKTEDTPTMNLLI